MKRNSSYRLLHLLLISLLLGSGCKVKDPIEEESAKFIRIYGTEGDERAWDIAQTTDGGFAILCEQIDSADVSHAMLLRTDQAGSLIWQQHYYGKDSSGKDCVLHDLLLLPDGSFLMAGYTTSTSSNTGGWIIHVQDDDRGTVDWEREYSINPTTKSLNALARLNNGQIVAVGDIGSGFWFLRTNGQGDVILEKEFAIGSQSRANAVVPVVDTLFAIGHQDGGSIQRVVWEVDGTFLRADGDEQPSPQEEEQGIGIGLLNGNLVAVGNTGVNGTDPQMVVRTYLRTTDSLLKEVQLGGNGEDLVVSRNFPTMGDSSSVILAGTTNSFARDQKDIYTIVVNPTTGLVGKQQYYGGRFDDIATSIVKTSSGFALCGHSNSFSYNKKFDIFIMKLDENGLLLGE